MPEKNNITYLINKLLITQCNHGLFMLVRIEEEIQELETEECLNAKLKKDLEVLKHRKHDAAKKEWDKHVRRITLIKQASEAEVLRNDEWSRLLDYEISVDASIQGIQSQLQILKGNANEIRFSTLSLLQELDSTKQNVSSNVSRTIIEQRDTLESLQQQRDQQERLAMRAQDSYDELQSSLQNFQKVFSERQSTLAKLEDDLKHLQLKAQPPPLESNKTEPTVNVSPSKQPETSKARSCWTSQTLRRPLLKRN